MLPIIGRALITIIDIIGWVLLVRIILSWVTMFARNDGVYKIYEIAFSLTEPFLSPIRSLFVRIFPGTASMPIDLSPIILWVLLDIITMILNQVFF